mmetsp:Transcript_35456/g.97928  ORF Transcript_35456/g.97928 Transcript_35456/m.97928 type:complete len:205 (-) Transcript_35456:495-1109(-)
MPFCFASATNFVPTSLFRTFATIGARIRANWAEARELSSNEPSVSFRKALQCSSKPPRSSTTLMLNIHLKRLSPTTRMMESLLSKSPATTPGGMINASSDAPCSWCAPPLPRRVLNQRNKDMLEGDGAASSALAVTLRSSADALRSMNESLKASANNSRLASQSGWPVSRFIKVIVVPMGNKPGANSVVFAITSMSMLRLAETS